MEGKVFCSGGMKKVMWSNESRFTMFQCDGCIRASRREDEVIHPSCELPTLQSFKGSALIWIQLFRSRLSNIMCPQSEVSQLFKRIE